MNDLVNGQLSELLPGSPETIPPQPAVDPWITAIEQADQKLNTNPDFENHIYSYLETVAEINQHLVLVEHAKPALDLIDQLKNTDISLICHRIVERIRQKKVTR